MVVEEGREENGESEALARNIYAGARAKCIASCAAGSSIDAIQYGGETADRKRGEF